MDYRSPTPPSRSSPGCAVGRRRCPCGRRWSSRGRLEEDAAAFARLRVRPHDNLDVAAERRQETHQAVDRIFAEVAVEQARDFRLADAHAAPHPDPLPAARGEGEKRETICALSRWALASGRPRSPKMLPLPAWTFVRRTIAIAPSRNRTALHSLPA